MPIINQTRNIPVDSIHIDRSSRQRHEVTFESVTSLALSIGTKVWISDILVEQDTGRLIAGERRVTAVKLLRLVFCKKQAPDIDENTQAQLSAIACNSPPAWENWTKIPGKYGYDLTPVDLLLFEFLENSERKNLSWQEQAHAVYSFHVEALTSENTWTAAHTARAIYKPTSVISRQLRAWRAYEKGEEKIKDIMRNSPSLLAFIAALDRVEDRRQGPLVLGTAAWNPFNDPKPAPAPGYETTPETISREENEEEWNAVLSPAPSPSSSLILNADFHDFAAHYSSTPFNFIHCDFPYGIEFNKKQGQNTSADVHQTGQYEDSAQVYYDLISTLATYSSTLLSPSCHIMFWYSQGQETETKDLFSSLFPSAIVQKFKMIWHCSNHSGLMPDPQRYGRRTYETAFLLTFGDRKIVKGADLSFSFSRINTEHRSQKPVEVLAHFFSMFVDETSRVLDPTCGSGTSLITAKRLGAAKVLGLERDPETYVNAVKHIDKELS